MPFKPTAEVTRITPESFLLTDTTKEYIAPSTNIDGYGAPDGILKEDIRKTRVVIQYNNDTEVVLSPSLIDWFGSGLLVQYGLRDGVSDVSLLLGVKASNAVATLSFVDGSLLYTRLDLTEAKELDNLAYVSIGTDTLYKVKAIDKLNGTVTFTAPLPTGITSEFFYLYYSATTKVLNLTHGQRSLLNDIGNMALTGCDVKESNNLVHRVMLKLAAQTAFSCKNWAKANRAAVLLEESPTNPCESC